jgi:hypothetical protein
MEGNGKGKDKERVKRLHRSAGKLQLVKETDPRDFLNLLFFHQSLLQTNQLELLNTHRENIQGDIRKTI